MWLDAFAPAGETALRLPDGRIVEWYEDDRWPVWVGDPSRQLEVVLRQWVEDVPSAALAKRLAQEDAWKATVQLLQRRLAIWDECRFDGSQLAADLSTHGLPTTAGTTRYLLAQLEAGTPREAEILDGLRHCLGASGSETLPTAGLLVTSLCLRPIGGNPGSGEVISIGTGSSPWAKTTHWERATDLVQQHVRWWREFPPAEYKAQPLQGLSPRDSSDPELMRDIARHLAGELDRDDLVTRALDRLRQRSDRVLDPTERDRERRRVAEAIRRSKKRLHA